MFLSPDGAVTLENSLARPCGSDDNFQTAAENRSIRKAVPLNRSSNKPTIIMSCLPLCYFLVLLSPDYVVTSENSFTGSCVNSDKFRTSAVNISSSKIAASNRSKNNSTISVSYWPPRSFSVFYLPKVAVTYANIYIIPCIKYGGFCIQFCISIDILLFSDKGCSRN